MTKASWLAVSATVIVFVGEALRANRAYRVRKAQQARWDEMELDPPVWVNRGHPSYQMPRVCPDPRSTPRRRKASAAHQAERSPNHPVLRRRD